MDAVVVLSTPSVTAFFQALGAAANRRGLPTVTDEPAMVAAYSGLLASYGADHRQLWRRTAAFVDRILRGHKPAEIPIEQPTQLMLAVNLGRARELNIALPPSLLARADEVLE